MARESKTGLSVDVIKRDDLYGMLLQAAGESAPLHDERIAFELFAAEDFYEQELEIFLSPRRVFSNPRIRTDAVDPYVRVSDYDPATDYEEPAYDYEAGMFGEHRWGQIRLNHGPVRSVEKVFWWYPGSAIGSSWCVASNWQRIDYQFARMDIVPADGPLMQMLTLNAFVLSSLAAGRSVPQSIFVDYTAGLDADLIQSRFQHLLKGIRLRTLLSLIGMVGSITTRGMSGSSLSIDGLSESRSFGGKWGAFSGLVDMAIQQEQEIRDQWKVRHNPVPVVFS